MTWTRPTPRRPALREGLASVNVKRWREGQMALQWCAAGMNEAAKQFRRVNGYLHLAKLAAELERVTAETVGADQHNETIQAA